MAARIGDPTDHGGVIILGEPTVEIGEVGMGSPVVSSPMAPLVILAQAMASPSSPASQAVSNAAQALAQSSQDATPSVEFTLANQPLAAAAGAPPAQTSALPSYEDLAAQEGDSPAQQAARTRVATAFYRANCPDKDGVDIASHVSGVDLHKPVEVVSIPPQGGGAGGDELWQWEAPGAAHRGEYFADDASSTPDDLGVDRDARVQRHHRAHAPMTALKSSAAPIVNTWNPASAGEAYSGGGTQIFIPKGNQSGFN